MCTCPLPAESSSKTLSPWLPSPARRGGRGRGSEDREPAQHTTGRRGEERRGEERRGEERRGEERRGEERAAHTASREDMTGQAAHQ
jgi:hypothetical protein